MAANAAAAMARNPQVQQAAFNVASNAAAGTMDQLVAKEREIAARLQSLRAREQRVARALASLQPNWPRRFCCIGPMVYHDIDQAVPPERISYVKSSYTNYFITIFIIVFNIICAIAAMATSTKTGKNDETSYTTQLAVSFIHLLGIPGAFLVWHFQIYNAVQPQGGTSRYGTAYLGICVAFVYDVFMAIGLKGYGGCGFLFAFICKDKKQSEVPFYLCLICAVMYSAQAIYFFWSFFRLRKYHRQDKAQIDGGAVLP